MRAGLASDERRGTFTAFDADLPSASAIGHQNSFPMLSPGDLEQIRSVVRDELRRALRNRGLEDRPQELEAPSSGGVSRRRLEVIEQMASNLLKEGRQKGRRRGATSRSEKRPTRVTHQEAARIAKVGLMTVEGWVRDGLLTASKLGKVPAVPLYELEAVIDLGWNRDG